MEDRRCSTGPAVTSGRGAVVIVVGVAVGLLTACGPTGPAADGSTPPGPATTDVAAEQQAWMGRLCDGIARVGSVAATARTAAPDDVGVAPQILAGRVRDVADEVDRLRDGVTGLGSPPVADGERVHRELLDEIRERGEALQKSVDFIENGDRSGPLSSVQKASAAQSAYTAAPMLARATERLDGLDGPFRATPQCRALRDR